MSLIYLGDAKRCSKCKKYKPFSEFARQKGGPGGRQSHCKECRNGKYRKYRDPEDRFWKLYHSRTVQAGECLEWVGAYNSSGSPVHQWYGNTVMVRRTVYRLACGELSDDELILVKCNNRRCVRHSHLKAGTADDLKVKLAQLASTGERHSSRTCPDAVPRGSRNGMSKLTEANVRAMREEFAHGNVTLKTIASRFGITATNVGYIVSGKTWKHVSAD